MSACWLKLSGSTLPIQLNNCSNHNSVHSIETPREWHVSVRCSVAQFRFRVSDAHLFTKAIYFHTLRPHEGCTSSTLTQVFTSPISVRPRLKLQLEKRQEQKVEKGKQQEGVAADNQEKNPSGSERPVR